MDIQIKNRMSYVMLGDAGSNEPDPFSFNPSIDRDTNTALIGRHLLGETVRATESSEWPPGYGDVSRRAPEARPH